MSLHKLSVIIPARNEKYLQKTINDVLDNMGVYTQVIVGLDNYWPDPPIKDDPRVILYHSGERIGMRPMINRLAKIADGEFLMKTDAHCSFDIGYAKKLITTCKEGYTVLGVRYELDVEKWEKKERTNCDFRYLSNPKADPLGGLRGLPWHEYKKRTKGQKVAESMSLSGSGWLMHKSQFEKWNGLDENHGTFAQEGCEIACKTWLSGGKLLIDRRTWYAHWNRGKAPYALSKKHREKSINYSIDLWLNNKWAQQTRPFEWLLKHFAPVPGWNMPAKKTMEAKRQGTAFKGLRNRYENKVVDYAVSELWKHRFGMSEPTKKERLVTFYESFEVFVKDVLRGNPIKEGHPYCQYLITHLHPNHKKPLTDIGKKRLFQKIKDSTSLILDIRGNGLKAPLEVYSHEKNMILVRGYRRLVIAKCLGIERVALLQHKNRASAKRLPMKFTRPEKGSIKEISQKQFMKCGGKSTDKYWTHGYFDIYDILFKSLRKKKIKLLEIGAARGASLAVWHQAFPKAFIYGVDKKPDLAYEFCSDLGNRVTIFGGNQQDVNFLRDNVIPAGPYHIIIDDGDHNPVVQKTTFDMLFSHVRPFGYYVVEDCHRSFANKNRGKTNFVKEMSKLTRLMYKNYSIWSVQFYYNMCVVQKGMDQGALFNQRELEYLRRQGGHL